MTLKNQSFCENIYRSTKTVFIVISVSFIAWSFKEKWVVASEHTKYFLENTISENIRCPDAFDNNQCIFIEDALELVIRKFNEKVEGVKLELDQSRINFDNKVTELKMEVTKLNQENVFYKAELVNITEEMKSVKNRYMNIQDKYNNLKLFIPKTPIKESPNQKMKKHKALYIAKYIDPIYQHNYNRKWNDLAILEDGNLFNISKVSMSFEQLLIDLKLPF